MDAQPATATETLPALDLDDELSRDEAFATWCDEHRDAWIADTDTTERTTNMTVHITARVYNGLDYYTATVTEARTVTGAKRAVSSPKYGALRATLYVDDKAVAIYDGRRWSNV